MVFAARAGIPSANTGTPFACGARCRRYWTTHLASTKPDLPANARDFAWTILRFFCTVEHDDEATRRCLNSIVAILRSVAGASDNKKQLVDYNQHLVAAVAELNQAQASFRGMVLLLPSVLRRLAPGEPIEIPSPATLRRLSRLMKFRDVRTARRGAQTKNKRTVWALRRVMHADHIIRRLHQYAPVPQPHGQQRVDVPSVLKVIAPHGAFAFFLDESDWRVFRCTCRGVAKFTLRCAAAIASPLSLDGMVHTDENAMKCTLSYVPSSQKLKEGEKPQQVQTVKFQCELINNEMYDKACCACVRVGKCRYISYNLNIFVCPQPTLTTPCRWRLCTTPPRPRGTRASACNRGTTLASLWSAPTQRTANSHRS